MPVLANPRHELFARALAGGSTIRAAYEAAGYSLSSGNYTWLRRQPRVAARIAELLAIGAGRTEISLAELAAQLDEDRDFARANNTPSAAISATLGKAKLLGLAERQGAPGSAGRRPDRGIDLSALTPEQLSVLASIRLFGE